MTEGGGRGEVFRVLFVCTGNLCRSPLAERLGRAHLDEVMGAGAARVQLSSAGTGGVVDEPMHPFSALVLSGLGGDPAGFSGRRLEVGHVEGADLVLTMTRKHRRDTLGLAPRALAKTFTLREAVDLARTVDAAPGDGEEAAARARAVVARMAAARSHRRSGEDDDIPDPIGRPVEIHQDVGEAIAEVLLPLLDRLFLTA